MTKIQTNTQVTIECSELDKIVSQEEWVEMADELADGKTLCINDITLCDKGVINGAGVDKLSRNIFDKLELKEHGISSPGWSGFWSYTKESSELIWKNWSLGSYELCVSSNIGGGEGYSEYIIIPDMPIPERLRFPDDCKTRGERREFKKTEAYISIKKRRDFVDVLALHHLAGYIFRGHNEN